MNKKRKKMSTRICGKSKKSSHQKILHKILKNQNKKPNKSEKTRNKKIPKKFNL